jgi:hypothetical protein
MVDDVVHSRVEIQEGVTRSMVTSVDIIVLVVQGG